MFKKEHGFRVLPGMASSTRWWLAFRCILLRGKVMSRRKGILGLYSRAQSKEFNSLHRGKDSHHRRKQVKGVEGISHRQGDVSRAMVDKTS